MGRPGEHGGRVSRDPLLVFSSRGGCEQFWHRQGRPPFDVVHRAFSLPTTVSPTLQKRIAALNLAIFPSFRLRSLTVTPAIEWFEPKRHIVSKTAYFQYKNTLVRHTPSVTVCLVG